jgi:hypothetical protein
MVLMGRISFLKEAVLKGRLCTVHGSLNPATGCEKVKFCLHSSTSSINCMAVLHMLDYVESSYLSSQCHVVDRGHLHTNGVSEACFYLRRPLKSYYDDSAITNAKGDALTGGAAPVSAAVVPAAVPPTQPAVLEIEVVDEQLAEYLRETVWESADFIIYEREVSDTSLYDSSDIPRPTVARNVDDFVDYSVSSSVIPRPTVARNVDDPVDYSVSSSVSSVSWGFFSSSANEAYINDGADVVDEQFAELILEPVWESAEFITAEESNREQYVDPSPQMPILDLYTIRDIGATVACSWWHAELLQPYLCLVMQLNGGCVSHNVV